MQGCMGACVGAKGCCASLSRPKPHLRLLPLALPRLRCRPIVQECIVPGTPEQLAQRCRTDERCAAFILKPGACFSWLWVSGCLAACAGAQRGRSQPLAPALSPTHLHLWLAPAQEACC